jgi:hypothetical protein
MLIKFKEWNDVANVDEYEMDGLLTEIERLGMLPPDYEWLPENE